MLALARRPSKSGGKPNLGREIAVCEAYRLLIMFGGKKKRPGLTRGGPWNKIANILYDDGANLFKTMTKFSPDEIVLHSDEIDFDPNVHEQFRTRTERK